MKLGSGEDSSCSYFKNFSGVVIYNNFILINMLAKPDIWCQFWREQSLTIYRGAPCIFCVIILSYTPIAIKDQLPYECNWLLYHHNLGKGADYMRAYSPWTFFLVMGTDQVLVAPFLLNYLHTPRFSAQFINLHVHCCMCCAV